MNGDAGFHFRRVLNRIAWRITLYRGSRCLCRGVLATSLPAFAILGAARFQPLPHAVPAATLLLLCGALWGFLEAARGRSSLREAALLADRRMSLDEMLPTALESGTSNPLGAALLEQAAGKTERLHPARFTVFPFPWEIAALFLMATFILALTVLVPPRVPARSSRASREAVLGAEARKIRSTAAEIDARFPGAGAGVSEKLHEIAMKMAKPSGNYTETGKALARLALDAGKEARRLERPAESLAAVLEGAETLLADDPTRRAGEEEKIKHALQDLTGDANLSADASEAARQALGALEGGDLPGLIRNARRLREELERLRAARLALETAGLRLDAAVEKLHGAFGDEEGEDATSPSPSRAAGGDRASPSLSMYRRDLQSPRWDPAYDDVVKRYFSAIGGE